MLYNIIINLIKIKKSHTYPSIPYTCVVVKLKRNKRRKKREQTSGTKTHGPWL